MKTIVKTLISFAVAAIAFAACSQDELNTPNSNDPITLKFNITKTAETVEGKAILGTEDNKTFLNWENNDKIGTFAVGSFGSGENPSTESKNNAGTVEVTGETCTLNVQTFSAGSVTNIYSYYPYSASAGKDKTAAIVTIPESQAMSASGFDADAMPMAGKPVSVDLTTVANTDKPCGSILFSNLGSIINFKIYSRTACDETITSVKYIGENIGGEFTIDLTSIDPESEASLALAAFDPIDAITTNCSSHPSLASKDSKDNAIDVFMVVAPGTYANSQVVVTTSAYTYTLTASGEKTYTRSHIKPMYVDIQNGTRGDLPAPETWMKVTSSNDFTAGTYYILRGDGAYYLPNVSSSVAPACMAFTASESIPSGMRWNATAGENGLIFESATHADSFLWGGTDNNTIRVSSSTPTANNVTFSKEWSFASLQISGTTYYTASAVSGRYLISYGVQDWRNYTGGSAANIPAEFYKLDESGKQTPTIAFSNPTTSVNVGESVTNVASIDPSSLAVSYSSSNTTVASVDASTGEVTGLAAGEAIITASFAENDLYHSAQASYTITVNDPNVVDYVTLDWNYAGGTSSDLNAVVGVTTNGLGSDYTSHSPYCVKFDGNGDYIQVKTDKAISKISVSYKMIGGSSTSHLYIYESEDGTTWGEKIDDLAISGDQNSIGTVTTTADFNSSSRFVKIEFKKGSNVGIGAISISKANTDPVIVASNVSDFDAVGGNSTLSYTVKYFTDDVEVGEATGCVTSASVSSAGTVTFTIAPNYTTSPASGTIVLQSAGDNTIAKTVNVSQLGSSLSVSAEEITIPAAATSATFTVTSSDFGYNAVVATTETGMNLSVSGGASGSASSSAQTVTISSITAAPTSGDAITLGTISVYRNDNSSDPQIKTITVKKAVAGATTYTLTFPDENSANNGLTSNQYSSTWTATIGTFNWNIANFNNNNWGNGWKYIKCGSRNNTSVATITTVSAIPEAIKTVKITIDAVTSSNVNSIKLYISSNGSTWEEEGSFAIGTGEKSVSIASPAANKYYKIAFDCKKGSSNGLVTLSKVVYTTN